MVWFIIAIINIASIVMFLCASRYLNYIDRKAQKHFEFNRMAIERLEKAKNQSFNSNYFQYPHKHYENYGQE